jgi:creatinine amidohydrolase
MPGRILKLEELTSPAVAELDRQKTAFFIAVSPLEGHGPHLPLGVDYFDAGFFAKRLADMLLLQRPDFDAIIIPTVPLGAQVYRQPGSLRTESRALYRVIAGLGESLAVWGFRYIFVLSGHGSPKHIVAIESACVKISRRYKIQMHDLFGVMAIKFLRGQFVDQISEQLYRPLSPPEKELLKSDIHGGWWETSMMLLLHPDLVGEFENLPNLKRGDKGAKRGYFGSPAMASREFAEASLKVMNEEAANIIEKILDGRNRRTDTISILYKIPLLRPYAIAKLIFSLMVLIILILLAIIIIR